MAITPTYPDAIIAVGPTEGNLTALPDPSAMTYGLQDISASDSGRGLDTGTLMYKLKITQKVKLNLTWNFPTAAQVSRILTAIDPEYFYVRYPDAKTNTMQVREFYVGDRSAPMKWYQLADGTRYSSLSFDLIER